MKFTLDITMNNDAFALRPDLEVARIISQLASNMRYSHTQMDREFQKPNTGKLFDINGNTVGKWEITDE